MRELVISRLFWFLNTEELFNQRYYCVAERIYDKFNKIDREMKDRTKRKHVQAFDVIGHITKLSDKDMLEVFELTLRRYATCM